jgi:hypothetical protein
VLREDRGALSPGPAAASSRAPASRRRLVRAFLLVLASLASVAAGRSLLPNGLRAQYFLGTDLAGEPVRTVVDDTFSGVDLSRRWRFRPPQSFSVHWSGFLYVDRPGLYAFTIAADDYARLFVDQRPVIQSREHGPGVFSGEVRLERGPHPVVLQYVQTGGEYALDWTWTPEGGRPATVPAWSLSPRSRSGAEVLVVRALGIAWPILLAAALALGAALILLAPPTPETRGGEREAALDLPLPRAAGAPALALFLGLAALQTWPLVTDLAHLSRNDNADTILNEWVLAWIAHQLPRDPGRLFSAPIFHPEPSALAFSEPLVVQGLMGAPLIWLGASPVLAYNLLLLAGLTLTGWATARVVTRWTGDWAGGLLAGIVLAFNAHTLSRLPHLQAQHVEFLPLALLSLDRLLRRPRWSTAAWLALWFVLQALTSIYLLVLTAVALVVAVLVRPGDWSGPRLARVAPTLGLSAALAAAALLPFLLPYWNLNRAGFERSLDEVAWFSARARDYWTTPSRLHGWLGTSPGGETSLFPGAIALALALVAVCLAPRPGDRRLRMCLAVGLAGVVLSFGPVVPGYTTAYFATPLLQAVRGAARFGYLGILGVAVASGFGLAALRRRLDGRVRARAAVSGLLLAAVFVEPLAVPITYEPFAGVPRIYRRLRDEPGGVVAHLPFPPPDAVFRNATYMLGATAHFKPMLNGYSGFVPPSYVDHYRRLARFPSEDAVAELRALDVTHVVVHHDRLAADASARVAALGGLQAIDVEGPTALYRVTEAEGP